MARRRATDSITGATVTDDTSNASLQLHSLREPLIQPLQTSRLSIRRFTEADLSDYLAYQSHPIVRRHLPGQAMSVEQVQTFLTRQSQLLEDTRDAYHAFAVVHREDQIVIGDVGLYLPSGEDRIGDLGFQFHPDYHGKGYAREAAEALLHHAFSTWKLRRVTASCDRDNYDSYRLMERLEMTPVQPKEEGDHLTYELSADFWQSSRQMPNPDA